MKHLLIVAMLAGALITGGDALAETLTRAERMTDSEIAEICAARASVDKARGELESVEKKIALAHQMKAESWMEWSTSVKFDGDYVLFYHTSMGAVLILR